MLQRMSAGVAIPNSTAARDAITCRPVSMPDASCSFCSWPRDLVKKFFRFLAQVMTA